MLEVTLKRNHIDTVRSLIDFKLENINSPTVKDYFEIQEIVRLMRKVGYESKEIIKFKQKYKYLYEGEDRD